VGQIRYFREMSWIREGFEYALPISSRVSTDKVGVRMAAGGSTSHKEWIRPAHCIQFDQVCCRMGAFMETARSTMVEFRSVAAHVNLHSPMPIIGRPGPAIELLQTELKKLGLK